MKLSVIDISGVAKGEVEFADQSGRAYAMLALPANKLMVLRETPERAAV